MVVADVCADGQTWRR